MWKPLSSKVASAVYASAENRISPPELEEILEVGQVELLDVEIEVDLDEVFEVLVEALVEVVEPVELKTK